MPIPDVEEASASSELSERLRMPSHTTDRDASMEPAITTKREREETPEGKESRPRLAAAIETPACAARYANVFHVGK